MMKLREIMSDTVVRIRPEEPVSVAARALARYNIGALPVCGSDGRLQGVVTDRDLVTREEMDKMENYLKFGEAYETDASGASVGIIGGADGPTTVFVTGVTS